MVNAQMRFSVCDQRRRLIGNALNHGDGEWLESLIDSGVPSRSITFRSIRFENKKVRNWFDCNQANLRVKRLVLTQRDFTMGHLLGQTRLFFLAELLDTAFYSSCNLLLSSVGYCNEAVQLAQLKQPTDIADTAIVGLPKDEMESAQEPM